MTGKTMWPSTGAKWIWISNAKSGPNRYVEFRRRFRLKKDPTPYTVWVSADSDYELWVDGALAGWNQFPNWPREKTFNMHDVTDLLGPGYHCVAVRVHYRGENSSTYAKGKPGMIFTLSGDDGTLLKSDGSWSCRLSESYLSGSVAKVSPQLGFTIQYDARGEDHWRLPRYQQGRGWKPAVELAGPTEGYWQSLQPRPAPLLNVESPKPATLIASGYLRRDRDYKSVARTMMADALITVPLAEQLDYEGIITDGRLLQLPQTEGQPLVLQPPPRGHGIYLVFDLGREEAGVLDLNVEAPGATVVDIGHGEHLDDLRVRTAIGYRNFADRYICRPGRQQWLQTYRRLGCRYLQLHIPKLTGPVRLYHATVRPVRYPFKFAGAFACGDEKLNDIWSVSRRTLDLCAHEHYEDCPWREQGMYTFDTRLQAMYGYYAFGETRLPKVCWNLFGGGLRHDGLLEFPAPGVLPVTIPGFTLHWPSAIWEHALYSGDANVIRAQYDKICTILDTALQRMTPRGIVPNSTPEDHWHFYEWTDGLEGIHPFDDEEPAPRSTDALYNLLLINALRSAAASGLLIGDERANPYTIAANLIAQVFDSLFWDKKRQAYASFLRNGKLSHFAQLTQALAILEGVTRNRRQVDHLRRMLTEDSGLVQAEFPSKLYLYQALLKHDARYTTYVLDEIRTTYGAMIAAGASSLWETTSGAEAFSRAGSLCHGWSAVLNYIAGAHVLGVRPLEPGFKRFTVAPLAGSLNRAQGVVPTPAGAIRVAWEQSAKVFRLRLRHPKKLKPVLNLPQAKKIEMV
jgi:hypothetical protein